MLTSQVMTIAEMMAKGITLKYEKKLEGFGIVKMYGNANTKKTLEQLLESQGIRIKK